MRLIDADALVEQMESDAEHMDNMTFKLATYAAINDINHQPTIEPQKWIPAKEMLPRELGEYLVTVKTIGWNLEENTEIDIAYWDDLEGFHKAAEVIAWMPLPDPYMEG